MIFNKIEYITNYSDALTNIFTNTFYYISIINFF